MARTGIYVPITVQAGDAKKEIREFNLDMKSVEAAYKAAAAEALASGDKYGAVAAKVTGLSEQLKLQQGVTESSNKALTAQRDKLEEYRKKLEDTKKALADAQAAGTANEEELKKLERAVSNANAQFELSQRRVDEWARNVRNSESAQRTMEASMRDAVNEINNFGGAIEEAGNKTGGFFSALSANVVGDAITGVFKSLANNAKQYMEQGAELARQWQEAQGKLVQVMGNTMGATREQVEAINELTLAQQRMGVVSQTVQTAGAQELATYLTKKETLESLIPVMNDMIAQQLGINASSEGAANIATMLGKVMDGQTGALKRYGYSFDEVQEEILKTGEESERCAVLIDVISASVGGMNEALAKTDAGKQAQLNFVLAETKQRIGEIYNAMKMEMAAGSLEAVERFSQSLLKMVEDNKDNIQGLLNILTGLVSFFLEHSKAIIIELGAIGGAIALMKLKDAYNDFKTFALALQAQKAAAAAAAAATGGQTAATVTQTAATVTNTAANVANAASNTALAAAETGEAAASAGAAAATGAQTAATVANTAANAANVLSIQAIGAAMMASPLFVVGVAAAAVQGVILAVDALTVSYEEQVEKVEKLTDEYKGLEAEAEELRGKLKNVAERIDELQSKDNLTVVEKGELAELENINTELEIQIARRERLAQLKKEEAGEETVELLEKKVKVTTYNLVGTGDDAFIMPGNDEKMTLDKAIRENINSYRLYEEQLEKVRKANEALDPSVEGNRRQIEENELIIDGYKEAMKELETQILSDADTLQGYSESLTDATEAERQWKVDAESALHAADTFNGMLEGTRNAAAVAGGAMSDSAAAADEMGKKLDESNAALKGAITAYNDLVIAYKNGEIEGKKYIEALEEQIEANRELAKQYPELAAQYNGIADILERRLRNAPEVFNELLKSTKALVSGADDLTKAFAEQAKEGELSVKTAAGMIEAGYAEALMFDEKTGKIRLNEEAYKDLVLAELEEQRASLERAKSDAVLYKLEQEREAARLYSMGLLDLAEAAREAAKASGQAAKDVDAQMASLEILRRKIEGTSVAGEKAKLDEKGGASAAKKAESEAEKARKDELKQWQEYYKERESESKKWVDRQKFYGELSAKEEAEAAGRIIDYLTEYKNEVAGLTFATEEEKLKIMQELNDKIDGWQRTKYTAEKNELTGHLKELTDAWKEYESELTSGLDKGKFYGTLSVEDEVKAYGEAIEKLKTMQEEAEKLTYSTDDERVKAVKDITDKIEAMERKQYDALKRMRQEDIKDAEYALSQKEKLAQRELNAAETEAQKIKAYNTMKALNQTKYNAELQNISKQFWKTDKEKLREAEAAYDKYADNIVSLDKNMRDAQKKQADEWLKKQKEAADKNYQNQKAAIDKELQMIKAAGDERGKDDKGREVDELKAQAREFANDLTPEGKAKYDEIMRKLKDKVAEHAVSVDASNHLAGLTAELEERQKAIEEEREKEVKSLEEQAKDMEKVTKDVSKVTVKELKASADKLEDGLSDMFSKYMANVDKMSDKTVDKVKSMAKTIADVLEGINLRFEQTVGFAALSGGGDVNVNINVNGPVVRDEQNIKSLTKSISTELGKQAQDLSTAMGSNRMRQ